MEPNKDLRASITKIIFKVALILGVGGLGSIILINLLRLGVKKIFLVDFDHVETHNLNR